MRVAIIGGSGAMGRWFARFLLKDGKEVVITGRNEKKLQDAKQQLGVDVASNAEAVKTADVVLLSVPIESFEMVVKEIYPYIQPRHIVVDITSIKALPVEIMHKYIKSGTLLGIHPVFGPGARGVDHQNFVLTPTTEREKILAEKVRNYLESRAAKVTVMTPQEHDEMMAVVLGLAHFISIVSADTLASFNKSAQFRAVGGSTYKVLLTLVESVIAEDPELYASLQMSLPNITEIEDCFQKNLKAWAELVKKKDKPGFVKRMTTVRSLLEHSDPDFRKAYENMYKIVGGL